MPRFLFLYGFRLSQDLGVNLSNITVSIQEESSNTEDTLGIQEQPSQLTDGVKISHELPKQVMENKIISYEEERALQLMERLQTNTEMFMHRHKWVAAIVLKIS